MKILQKPTLGMWEIFTNMLTNCKTMFMYALLIRGRMCNCYFKNSYFSDIFAWRTVMTVVIVFLCVCMSQVVVNATLKNNNNKNNRTGLLPKARFSYVDRNFEVIHVHLFRTFNAI